MLAFVVCWEGVTTLTTRYRALKHNAILQSPQKGNDASEKIWICHGKFTARGIYMSWPEPSNNAVIENEKV